MGVRGLQTFLKDNRGSLCRSVILPETGQGDERVTVPIVVDAWGIIFKLYLDSLPWTSGGEYLRFYKIVKALVTSWRRVGLEPTFVFDGAAPPAKHETLLRRLSEQILTCQLFYTTSKTSRSTPSFSRDPSGRLILPAFASHAFIFALSRLNVKTHFVPLGEADGVCVTIAEKLGAYVLGQDSDFVILVGRAGDRIKGYCPLDMVSWIEGDPPKLPEPPTPPPEVAHAEATTNVYRPPGARNRPDPSAQSDSTSTDSFITVNNRRHDPHTPRQSPLLPPTNLAYPALVLTNYPPQGLRQRLRLPPKYLPLFASLCGNDYTPPSAFTQFFEPTLSSSQKIEKAARVLREQLFSPSNSPQSTKSHAGSSRSTPTPNPADQVVDLVKRVVKKLSIFPFDMEQSLLDLVDIIIDAALEYALPHGQECCSTYPFCGELDPLGCRTPQSYPDLEMHEDVDDGDVRSSAHKSYNDDGRSATRKYAAAQRRGLLNSLTQGWLYPDRVYLWSVLEDPSLASLRGSDGARAIRSVAWSVADEGLGGLRWPEAEMDIDEKQESRSTVELEVDIVDQQPSSDGDAVSAKEGEEVRALLEADNADAQSHIAVADGTDGTTASSRSASDSPRTLHEWIRQGSSSRVLRTPLQLSSPSTRPTPACLEPLDTRLQKYLATLHSDTPTIRALPMVIQPLVAIVRLCIIEAAARVSKADTSRWRRDEVSSVLRAGIATWGSWRREMSSEIDREQEPEQGDAGQAVQGVLWPLLESRNSNIVAQLSACMADAHILAQALLLLPEGEDDGGPQTSSRNDALPHLTHLIPFVFFSGVTLHTLLLKKDQQATPPSGLAGWKWDSEEEDVYQQCWTALIEGMEDKIAGLSQPSRRPRENGHLHNGDGNDDGDGAGAKAGVELPEPEPQPQRKSKEKRKGKKSVDLPAKGRGRFDILSELGDD